MLNTKQTIWWVWLPLGEPRFEFPPIGPFFGSKRADHGIGNCRDDILQQAVITFVKAMEERDLKCRKNVSENPAGLPFMHTFFFPSPLHLLTSHIVDFMDDQKKTIFLNLRTHCCFLRLGTFDVRFLLAVLCGAIVVNVEASNNSHNLAGFGLFSCRWFGAGVIMRCYKLHLDNTLFRHDEAKAGPKNI